MEIETKIQIPAPPQDGMCMLVSVNGELQWINATKSAKIKVIKNVDN